MEEVSFPRGGKPAGKPEQKKKKEKQADLFETHDGEPLKKKAKKPQSKREQRLAEKKAKVKKEKSEDQFNNVQQSIGILTIKGLSAGMLVVGVVKEIHEYQLIVSLPSGIRGQVALTNVSQAYTAQLRKIATGDTSAADEVGELSSMYRIGQTVRCKVTEVVRGGKKGHYKIHLTTDPAEVNAALAASDLKNNMVLSACVASCEDHGYVLDIGVKGVNVFLKDSKAEEYIADWRDGEQLVVGAYLHVLLTGDNLERSLGEGRAINVEIEPAKVNKALIAPGMGVTIHSLVAGMCLKASVSKVEKEGLRLKMLSYKGYVHRSHLPEDVKSYNAGDQHVGTVLYIEPMSKVVVMSFLPHLIMPHLCPRKLFANLQLGNVLEDVEVVKRDKVRGVYVKITDDIMGMAYLKDLTDAPKLDLGKEFAIGSKHSCRVLDFDYADRVVRLSFKKSVLEKQFMQLKDISPGMIVEGNVKEIVKKGVVVKVTKNIDGFIHSIHLADVPLQHPEKAFKVGQKLKCRAVTVNLEKRRLVLTHKKSLVQTSLPVVTEYQQLSIGQQLEGVIIQVIPAGLLVAFYNNVRGLIPKRELGDVYLEQAFQAGQLMKCFVVTCVPAQKRLILAIKKHQGGARRSETLEDLPEDLPVGKAVDCSVKTVQKEGLEVELDGYTSSAYLPRVHLSDLPALSDLMAQALAEKDVLGEVVVFGAQSPNVLVSNKRSVKQADKEKLGCSIDDLAIDSIIPGCIRRVLQQGVLVDLYRGKEGFVPRRLLADRSLPDPAAIFTPGQSVLAKVMTAASQRGGGAGKQVDVSLRLSDVGGESEESGRDIMHDYVNFYTGFRTIRAQQEEKSLLYSSAIGSIVKVTVKKVSDSGLVCSLEDGSAATVSESHMKGMTAKAGSKLDAVVLFHNVPAKQLEVSVRKSLVEDVRNYTSTKFTQVTADQAFDSEVLLVKEAFVLVALKSTAKGKLAYMPAKSHLNDILGSRQFLIGQNNKVIIDSVEDNDLIFASLVKDRKKRQEKEKKDGETGEAGTEKKKQPLDFGVGSVHTAKVKCVKGVYVHIDIRGRRGRVHISELDIPEITREGMPVLKPYTSRDVRKLSVRVLASVAPTAGGAQSLSKPAQPMLECTAQPGMVKGGEREALKKGDLCNVFVTEVHKDHLVVSARHDVSGIIYLHDATAALKVIRNARCYFKVGQAYTGQVLTTPSASSESANSANSGFTFTVLDTKPVEELADQLVLARVEGVTATGGLALSLPSSRQGTVAVTDITDTYHDYPAVSAAFAPGSYLQGYVVGVSEDGGKDVAVSLRRSRLGYPKDKTNTTTKSDPEIKSIDQIEKSSVIRGYVIGVSDSRILVEVSRALPPAYVLFPHTALANTRAQAQTVFHVGQVLTAYVLNIKNDSVQLSLLQKHTNVQERRNIKPAPTPLPSLQSPPTSTTTTTNSETASRKNKRKLTEDSDNEVSTPKKKAVLETTTAKATPPMKSQKRKARDEDEEEGEVETKKRCVVEDKAEEEEEAMEAEESSDEEKEEIKKVPAGDHLDLGGRSGFSWDNEASEPQQEDNQEESEEEDDEDEEEEEGDGEEKPKKQPVKKGSRAEQEKRLYELEQARLAGDINPDNADEFDRLVLQSPNSSMVWLKYMAFHLELGQTDKAREIAERALKTISFREEDEKLNVWVAFLNLENMSGSPETLTAVFERALKHNEQSKVYKHMAQIYATSDKIEEADRLYGVLLKKFGNTDLDAWVKYATFLFSAHKHDVARKLLPRALIKMERKKDHVELTSKMAQLEFKYGEPEKGKSLFESLVTSYPKRTDLWSIYIDMLTKAGDVDCVRPLYERAINLKITTAKIKTFFEKYLKFEQKFGSNASVKAVKQKIMDFVNAQ